MRVELLSWKVFEGQRYWRRQCHFPAASGRLIALDSKTGRLCEGFGNNGEVDLEAGLGSVRGGEYIVTSPPQIVGDKVITGALVAELHHSEVPSGVVRAFDARTGRQVWAWDPLQKSLQLPADFRPGSPNAWAPFSADSARKLVFIPTGNPSVSDTSTAFASTDADRSRYVRLCMV